MKIKFKVFLPTVVTMLFVLSLTGYAHGKHHESDETKANTSLKNPLPISADDSLVSRWLEAQLSQEFSIPESRNSALTSKSAFGLAWVFDEGQGWCDLCGCGLRHGLEPWHGTNCSSSGPSCASHAGNCYSSGGQ